MEPRSQMGPQWGNYFNVFILKKYLNTFLSRNYKPISIKRSTNYPWVKRIQACTSKGQGQLDNYQNAKYGGVILKSSRETHCQKNTHLHESFLTKSWFSFSKSWSQGGMVQHFYKCLYWGKCLWIIYRLTMQLANFNQM